MDDDQSTEKTNGSPHASNISRTPENGTGVWSRVRNIFSTESDTSLRESLEEVIEQHEAENGSSGFKPEARSMMLNLLEFADMRVDDVMVPRADIIAIDEAASLRDLLELFTDANHSRLPAYRETLDDPVGMVHIKDLLRWMSATSVARAKKRKSRARAKDTAPPTKPANGALSLSVSDLAAPVNQSGLIRDMLFVPPSMPAADLLVKMQSTRIHMAIVVDEYGGTDGIVSIEDLIEEIVGDITDEHDEADEDLIKPAVAGSYVADARATIEDVETLLGVDLLPDEDDEDTDTLGGLVFSMLGRVPVRGELIKHPSGIEFEITGADPRRVKTLKIHTRPHALRANDTGQTNPQ